MVTQRQVDEVVAKYVPEEYKPGGLVAYKMAPELAFYNLCKSWGKQPLDDKFIGALIFDINEIEKTVGIRPAKEDFVVYINEAITNEDKLTFIVLHEVGHLHWQLKRSELTRWSDDKEELHSDFYAFERIVEVAGMEKAISVLQKVNGSINGFGAVSG